MDGEENRPAFESLPTLTKCDLRSVTILEGLTSCLWYVEKGTTRQSQSEGLISSYFSAFSDPFDPGFVGGAFSLTSLPPAKPLCYRIPGWLSTPLPTQPQLRQQS